MKKTLFCALLLFFVAIGAGAQNITVHGTVTSRTDGEPLIGASVIPVSSPAQGVATDLDGNFTLSVKQGEQLKVSYVGYITATLEAAPEMKIQLSEDSEALDEVVVVGYTTQRKADLTGAVAVMDLKKPLSENSGNIINSMAGKLPGVNVVPDAAPGGTGSIRVRGMSCPRGEALDPLYIVDGVPTDNINCINPGDIETMQVLKDAASASIYGSRAANGVVIITTKQGKGDRMSISLNYAASAQTIAKRYKMLGTQQWADTYWQAYQNSYDGSYPTHAIFGSGSSPVIPEVFPADPSFRTADTDWQDQVYHTAWTNNVTASISNATDKSTMFFSVNYINQDGNIRSTFYERYSARVNSTYTFNKYVSVGENLLVSRWTNRGVAVEGDEGIAFTAMSMNPVMPVTNDAGQWAIAQQLIDMPMRNPMQVIANDGDDSNNSWRILGNAYLQVNPVDGLALKSNIGIEHSQFFSVDLARKYQSTDQNAVSSGYGQGDTWTWTNTANYNKVFGGKHHVGILLGTEAIGYTFKDLSASRANLFFEDTDYMQVGAGTTLNGAGGGKSQWSVFSLFGKADYNFDDRYLASFTIRRDENSRFAKKNRAGVFPAFSLAWRPTQEAFFPKNDILTDLKIRYSWGQNGNANIGSLYPTYSEYEYSDSNAGYDMNGTGTSLNSGIKRRTTGNPDIKWETTTQNNIGLDMQLLHGKINITADYYTKKTTDMLTCPPVLDVAGENAAKWLNTGTMDNKGWEVQIAYNSPQYGDFSWSGNLNISQYKNKVVKISDSQKVIRDGDPTWGQTCLVEGQPMGVYYGWVCDGIFQNWTEVGNHAKQDGAAPGRLVYRDIDGNGVIDDDDRCIIGDPNPDLSLGLNLQARYKGFTLDMFFAGDFGFDIGNMMKRQLLLMDNSFMMSNRGEDILNAWTPANTNTDIPAVSVANANNERRFSTWNVEDGSYWKMKYLKLSYALPKSLISKIACRDLSLYFQVENVFTATSYKGLDPELLPGTYGRRFDNGAYPRPRTYTMGVNFQF